MSDETYDVNIYDVVIAGYADIETAKKDFDALVAVVGDKKIKTTEGVILVEHDADGEAHVTDAADHHGRKGLEWGGGIGVVAGLFAPPLLAVAVIGAAAGGLVGKFTKHRIESGIEEKIGETIPKGTAGIITLVGVMDTDVVKGALKGAATTNVVGVQGDGIKALKEGLAEAAKGAKTGS
jgi:arylsulfatase